MFKLKSNFYPTGDQPSAIETLTNNINNGVQDQILLGVTGSGKTFTIANVIKNVEKPTLILAPNKTLAAQLYQEYKKFFPENAVEYFVSYYDYYQPEAYIKSTDTYIEKDSAINDEIDRLKNAATAALINRKDVIIIASVSAIYGLGSPEKYKKLTIPLDLKTGYNRKKLIGSLINLRYERNDISFERGKFRIKGDVIDVYPASMKIGYRLEYFGDDLEEISEIDTLSGQKIKRNIQRIIIPPANHYVTETSEIDSIISEIKKDLIIEVSDFKNQGKLLEAQRLEQRTNYDIEMIKEIGHCKGIENYSRYLTFKKPGTRPDTLIDYFPKDFLIVIDESHISIPQINGMYKGDFSRKTNLVDNGFRLKSALDNRPLKFNEFRSLSNQTIFVSATPGEYESTVSKKNIAEQLIRPTGIIDPEIEVRKSTNQIDDLLNEITLRIKINQRVLVTTLTKKTSEELTEYYSNLGIKVKYMHSEIDTLERIEIIKELRNGEIDVLVGINLLREGLDIPEVSLVAILEADKEGFLRSRRSFIQTIGRAARNINGKAILYGDIITKSMREAIEETNRRRNVQREYNKFNNINPTNIVNSISKTILNLDYGISENDLNKFSNLKNYSSKKEIEREIKKLEKEIKILSEEFDFEKAIKKRDKMLELKEMLMDF
ncbi:excinuclease ABC subunit UvrB [Fusobacterium sp. IOR10]|uniref:excinuclease ABC subunit UvrB n=1 Tax=Fusobacterium sp. IOR10 TaxID=2665157 RepID=UPI0013D19ADB|nr:excinuclease ABC subunit UvrB [Fusobacterium sp. IOR10]